MKTYKNIEYIVFLNDHLGTFCGYAKLPADHPFAAVLNKQKTFKWGGIKKTVFVGYEDLPIECHGGLTFGHEITKEEAGKYPQGFTPGFWIGWDYAHAGDYTPISPSPDEKRWSAEEVEEECHRVIDQIIKSNKK